MKRFLLSIIAAAALVGCGVETKSETKKEPKTGYAVDELADEANMNKEVFMGKEVVVYGYAWSVSGDLDGDGYKIGLDFDLRSPIERQVSCIVPHGQPPQLPDKELTTVKGKISNIHRQAYMDLKSIQLEPCELVD